MGPHYDSAIRQQRMIAEELQRQRRRMDEPLHVATGFDLRAAIGVLAILAALPLIFG